MPASNSDRTKRGNSFKRVLAYMMKLCKDLGYISNYEKDYKIGMPGYTDQNQFKAPYRIEFSDYTEWIVFTTTSLRERIKEQYWDSFNLKQLNQQITRAYLVYPDSLDDSDRRLFEYKNTKIQNNGEFSSLDALVSQDGLFNRIEAYAIRTLTPNQQRDVKGNNFEKRVAATLKNPCNLDKWKTQDSMLEGLHYNLFTEIVDTFGLVPDHITSIDSTSDKTIIGLLPSGGPAKTDVLTTVTYDDGHVEYYTISCKRSSSTSVSVHQYSADSFANVLDANNTELRRVLNAFQTCGNKRDMLESDIQILETEIQPHILALCQWAIAGIGGEGNPDTQWANYILVYDNNSESFTVHPSLSYCNRLANDCIRTFNTPFSWTYQGTRGTNIQLKCPLDL